MLLTHFLVGAVSRQWKALATLAHVTHHELAAERQDNLVLDIIFSANTYMPTGHIAYIWSRRRKKLGRKDGDYTAVRDYHRCQIVTLKQSDLSFFNLVWLRVTINETQGTLGVLKLPH